MSDIRIITEKAEELVKVEFPRLITGSLGLGKLEYVGAAQDEDVCEKQEVIITIKGSGNNDKISFIVNKEGAECLLSTSLGAFINICKTNGLSAKREFQRLYPTLFL